MSGLKGKRIGLAADRSADAISKLIQKQGGEPEVFSIQGRQQLNEEISMQNIRNFIEKDYSWAVFTTGIGAKTLADSAINAGLYDAYIKKMKRTKLAIRGSKTMNWLKNNDLQANLVSEDGTMENLLRRLADETTEKEQEYVFLQAYNEDDAKLKGELDKMGYCVYISQPYSYKKPDSNVINSLKKNIAAQQLDAVVFTSKTQVRNLFQDEADNKDLINSFNSGVLAAAVGQVTAADLERKGIEHVLQPATQKMGAMVVEMDRYYKQVNS